MADKSKTLLCRFCFADLWHEHTFIECAAEGCRRSDVDVCLRCFAGGAADDVHRNDHPYRVLCNAVDVGDRLWRGHEEIELLDAFMETMSWERVAQKLDRSPEDCERHYFDNYVLCPTIEGLERVNRNAFRPDKFNRTVDGQTKPIGLWSSSDESYHQYELAIRLAGYQPARGSFEEEYDNRAECILELLNEPIEIDRTESNSLYRRLNETVLDIFGERLQERRRRKQIVRDYGLVSFHKHQLWIKSLEIVLGPEMMQHLIRYLHLIKPLAFDMFISNLKREHELLGRIHKLIVFRKNGLTKLAQINIFRELSAKKEKHSRNRPSSASTLQIIDTVKPRMNVCNLPGFQKLSDDERQLCTLINMLPESYLKFKELLVNECKKSRGINLKTARRLVKIDVNKTRKIYNLLMNKNILRQFSDD